MATTSLELAGGCVYVRYDRTISPFLFKRSFIFNNSNEIISFNWCGDKKICDSALHKINIIQKREHTLTKRQKWKHLLVTEFGQHNIVLSCAIIKYIQHGVLVKHNIL
jgi:hypothetical protein